MINVGIIGTGYVGLVTGCCLAETGNKVLCMDTQAEKVERMNAGEVPIYEPGLARIFSKNKRQERLQFTHSLEEVVQHAEVLFLTLPTPQGADGFADLSSVLSVAEAIIPYIHTYKVVVDKSTVPVGTAGKIKALLSRAVASVDVVSNPEFLREGYAVEDFMKPDRIVIGTDSTRAKELLNTLYAPYIRQGNPIFFTDLHSAELSKYASNAFLATKISFMNELALLCEKVGANVDKVREIMGTDARNGKAFLYAGIGYGGSCFPKDVQALVKISEMEGVDFKILHSVLSVNKRQQAFFFQKIHAHYKGNLQGKRIGIWGLAFKPNTDDIRDAPSIFIIDQLLTAGACIQAYDPEAGAHIAKRYGNKLELGADMYEAAKDVDALVVLTEWAEFRTPDWDRLEKLLKHTLIFDGRNIFEPSQMRARNFTYYNIGRGDILPNA